MRLLDTLRVGWTKGNTVRIQALLTGDLLLDESVVRSIPCAGHLPSIGACPSKRVAVLDVEVVVKEVADIVEVLVVESGGGKTWDGEGATGSSGVGCAHGGRANAAGAKAIEKRRAMTGVVSSSHEFICTGVAW